MESEKDIKKELKDIAPDFPLQQRQNPPAGYFEQLPDQILTKWKNEQAKPPRAINPWWRISGVAAAVMILLLGGWLLSKEKTIDPKLAITAEDAYQYVHENIEEFETLLEEVDVNLTNDDLEIPEEDIRQYLIQELDADESEELF